MESSTIYKYKDIIFSCFHPEESLTEQRLPRHALVYVYSGAIHINYNGKELIVNAGEYVFLRKDHRLRLYKHTVEDKPYKAISIRFDRAFLKEYFSRIRNNGLYGKVHRFDEAVIKINSSPYIESIFSSLYPFTDRGIKPDEDFIASKMDEAIRYLLQIDERFYPTLFDFNAPWKIDLLDFMEKNYTQDMTISEFASYSGRSLASFKRDFMRISDLSPQKWIIDRRLEEARRLLEKGNRKINDIWVEVGFKNRSHFSSAFKHKFGYSPARLMSVKT